MFPILAEKETGCETLLYITPSLKNPVNSLRFPVY